MLSRRGLLIRAAGGASMISSARTAGAERIRITGLEVAEVRVNARGNWLFVRLAATGGLTGLGEASQGTRGPQTTADMVAALRALFATLEGRSPFEVEAFRLKVWPRAKSGGLLWATAASALEGAMWDLAGQAAGVPVTDLLGGRVRESLPMYANINRATNRRTPEEFAANAAGAVADGFRAVKAAPFDDFPKLTAPAAALEAALDLGVRRTMAMRQAIGSEVALLLDCHSHFDRRLAIEAAQRLAPASLYWYEEPVDPEQLEDTAAIKQAIEQKLSGGESMLGREAFEPLCRSRALDFIMPDVKHCGGILEGKKIAALAEVHGVAVAPHNPAGPVSTAASAQLCATLPNFAILEYAWGEVPWRAALIEPVEEIVRGEMKVGDRPGLGIRLNEATVSREGKWL